MRSHTSASHGARHRPSSVEANRLTLPAISSADRSVRATGERDALMRIAATAAAANRLEDVLESVAEAARAAMGPGSLAISRWERDLNAMRVLINVGELGTGEERFPARELYPLDDNPHVANLLQNAVPYFNAVDDPDAHPKALELLRALGKESDIAVPVIVEGEVWGEVWASTDPGAPRFRASDVRFLDAVAGQLAALIARAQLFSNVSRLAYEDELTGLANRRALEERLEISVTRYRDEGVRLSLLVCDVDNLKAINDGRGHHAGDRALRRVGEALVAAAAGHPAAIVARLSGDEFAVILEDGTLDDARTVGGTALRLLGQERDVPVSLSCGAAAAAPGTDRPDRLLRAADTAQYAAKRRGGAQVCTAEASAVHRPVSSRRRTHRRHAGERLDEAVAGLLAMLDGSFVDRSTLDRLEATVSGLASALNAAAWTISFCEHGSATIQSISAADDRDSRVKGMRVGLDGEVYALGEYPLTAEVIRAGAGSFYVDRHDRGGDPAERELLSELGFSAVLGAAVPDLDGAYLVELYADGDSADLAAAELRVQLLARAAAGRSSSSSERMRQLRKRTHQLSAASALGARLAGLIEESAIVEAAVDTLYNEFDFPVCAINRLTGDNRLELTAGRGRAVERLIAADGWSQPAGLGLTGRTLRDRDLVVVGDVRKEPDYRPTAETNDTRSEMCAPLWAGETLWGVIDLQNQRIDAFDEDDARLVSVVADQVSAALRSASLYRQLEGAYLGTAEALVAALEAKDSYTASHSRSIGENAEAVGRALGLDETELRTLRFGAAFHDIGKLAIPESILCKPGPLTPEERLRVEQHTVIGDQILAPIEFLAEVRPLVRHSHERWDGGGYPDGLAGEAIPLGARIIFACDAYDAMTTDRPYRAALGDDLAASELAVHAGSQFDPRVVEALLSVLEQDGLRRRELAPS